ncbi:MAG: hypothetical protein ACJ76H_08170 [Bacteriovoracaceae bacterium]
MKKHLKKIMGLGIGVFLTIGCLNAFLISGHSELTGDITYVKGLDEMFGLTRPGRVLATNSRWQKIEEFKDVSSPVKDSGEAVTSPEMPAPAIAEQLSLDLVEVVNPKIWNKGIQNTQFQGELATSNGTIESLTVNLPGREEISISFAEMNGNVFQYDYAGEIYSGMIYQVDPKSYMVTLTNGPLEGTRMRFVDEFTPEQVEIKQTLKEENNIDVGFFGDNAKETVKEEKSPATDPSLVEAQMTNMDAQV